MSMCFLLALIYLSSLFEQRLNFSMNPVVRLGFLLPVQDSQPAQTRHLNPDIGLRGVPFQLIAPLHG